MQKVGTANTKNNEKLFSMVVPKIITMGISEADEIITIHTALMAVKRKNAIDSLVLFA